jgi:hypothetical protein
MASQEVAVQAEGAACTRNQPTALYLALTTGAAIAAVPVLGQQPPPRVAQFLHESIGLDSTQFPAVENGKAVVKLLDTRDTREVAVFGIIAVDRPRPLYIARVRDVEKWLRTPDRRRFGVFGDPATAAEVQDLTMDSNDVAALKSCHPGDCKVKLPATEMRRIREEIDWSADAGAGAQVNAYARRRMLQYVTDYRARGDSAMVVYDDRGSVRASDAFSSLLAQSPYLFQYSASFHRYLASYPHAHLDGVSDVLYWSDDALPSLRPILSITHLSVFTPPDLQGVTIVAGKQIYADHYFEAAFDLMAVVDRPTPTSKQGVYLIVIRRFRFDNLPSGGIINLRAKVVGKLRDKMRTDLEREKATSELELEQ